MDFALATPTAPAYPATPAPASWHYDQSDPWSPPALKLVCLDIDDTLVDFTAACQQALRELTERGDLWPLWERITEEHVAMVVAGELAYAYMHVQRTQRFLVELGAPDRAHDAERFERRRLELVHGCWRLFDDVLACLEWLRAAGVAIAAVTNASGWHQRGKLASLGLASFFDHVAIAGEVGAAKPDRALFHAACTALGVSPSQAVHVGDKLGADAIGARDAGLGGVWLNRTGVDGEAPADVHTVTDLGQLPELLVFEFAKVGVGC